jgi:DNA-directed RNA polymerase specialized sigma24 family protein
VFNLYAVDGFKHDEIANMLGISTGTSKAHLFKARKKLQEMLTEVKKSAEWNKPQMQ